MCDKIIMGNLTSYMTHRKMLCCSVGLAVGFFAGCFSLALLSTISQKAILNAIAKYLERQTSQFDRLIRHYENISPITQSG